MFAGVTEGWSDLYVASAGASAALAGLVFVAVSINVERILRFRGLPERALVTVLLLLGVVAFSLLGLLPDQSAQALGAELLISSLLLALAVLWLTLRNRPEPGQESHLVSSLVVAIAGTLPFVVAGAVLLAGEDAGLYVAFAGMIGAIVGAVGNAWVLLVEILR